MAGPGASDGGKLSLLSHRPVTVIAFTVLCFVSVTFASKWHTERNVRIIEVERSRMERVRIGNKQVIYYTSTTREGLEVRNTSIPNVPEGVRGLFTTRPIKKGDFVGFYCGDHYTSQEYENHLGPAGNLYTYEMAPGTEKIVADPTNQRHKICIVNEPSGDIEANLESMPYFHYAAVYGKGIVPVAIASALHATKDIERESELFVYYGKRYESARKSEGYVSKDPGKIYLEDKKDLQDPVEALGHRMPLDCFVPAPHEQLKNAREIFVDKGMDELRLRKVTVEESIKYWSSSN
mmetsp:Transcript_9236/g.21728  ORF Transcript_9236/g.21728 Transcript_9236/m.21728 type:complete len:293 (-) Transcript_9236:60-938(-)